MIRSFGMAILSPLWHLPGTISIQLLKPLAQPHVFPRIRNPCTNIWELSVVLDSCFRGNDAARALGAIGPITETRCEATGGSVCATSQFRDGAYISGRRAAMRSNSHCPGIADHPVAVRARQVKVREQDCLFGFTRLGKRLAR